MGLFNWIGGVFGHNEDNHNGEAEVAVEDDSAEEAMAAKGNGRKKDDSMSQSQELRINLRKANTTLELLNNEIVDAITESEEAASEPSQG